MTGPLALLRGTTIIPSPPGYVHRMASRHYVTRGYAHWRKDHGTHRCYNAGCKCDACTDAEARYSRAIKRRRRNA